jgi:hypothetical protein
VFILPMLRGESSIPRSVQVFELGIDRANEVGPGAENVDVGARQTGASRPGSGSVVEKLRTAWVKRAPSGSFDSAPQALCHAIKL